MSNELQQFNYKQLDQETAQYLRQLEKEGRKATNEFIFTWGDVLLKGQEKLKNGKYGCFEEWAKSLGFTKTTAFNYMNVAKELDVQILNINDIQKSLLYEITKPSANPELKQKVLNGEITKHKEYKELELKLKQVEDEKLGVSQSYYSLIESGKRIPNNELVSKLNKLIGE